MKLLFEILLWILFSLSQLNAQRKLPTDSFIKEKHILTIGYGYKSWYQTGVTVYEHSYEKTFDAIGPLHIKYEYGLTNKIGVGLSVAYHKYSDINDLPVLGYRIVGKMYYHFLSVKRVDVYCDIGIGTGKYEASYSIGNSPPGIIKERKILFEMESGLGTRYFFTRNFGLYIEAGIGKALFQGGIAIAF